MHLQKESSNISNLINKIKNGMNKVSTVSISLSKAHAQKQFSGRGCCFLGIVTYNNIIECKHEAVFVHILFYHCNVPRKSIENFNFYAFSNAELLGDLFAKCGSLHLSSYT